MEMKLTRISKVVVYIKKYIIFTLAKHVYCSVYAPNAGLPFVFNLDLNLFSPAECTEVLITILQTCSF